MRKPCARDLARRDRLVDAHISLVPPIALRLLQSLPPSFDLDDLMAVGYLALIKVAARYDPKQHNGTPFSAFARHRIRGAMLDSVKRRHYLENTRPSVDELKPVRNIDPEFEGSYGEDDRCVPTVEATIEISMAEDQLQQRVNDAIARLPTLQRAVIKSYYADNAPSLATVGAALGLAEWRVIREHADAIAELRRLLKAA